MTKLEKAKRILDTKEYTCVVIKDNQEFCSRDRGVKPILTWMDEGKDFEGATVADKVIGRAAAFLFVRAGIAEIYASVMSTEAIHVFQKYHITYECDDETAMIRNRTNTGFCPMEQAVMDIDEPQEAFEAVLNTIKLMKQNKTRE